MDTRENIAATPATASRLSQAEPPADVARVRDFAGEWWQRGQFNVGDGKAPEQGWTDSGWSEFHSWSWLDAYRGPLTWDGMPPVDLSTLSGDMARTLPLGTPVLDGGTPGTLAACTECSGQGRLVRPDGQPEQGTREQLIAQAQSLLAKAGVDVAPDATQWTTLDIEELRRRVGHAIGLHPLTTELPTKPLTDAVLEVVEPALGEMELMVKAWRLATAVTMSALNASNVVRAAAVASVDALAEPAKRHDFRVIAHGLVAMSVCTSLTDEAATSRLNITNPTGIASGWVISEDAHFDAGQPNPCPCEEWPDTHRHILFNC